MTTFRKVQIHPNHHPDIRLAGLLHALEKGCIPGRCHYQGLRQTRLWLDLYRKWSPMQNDSDARGIYRDVFRTLANEQVERSVSVVGLGCGNGDKEMELIRLLRQQECRVQFVACDASLDLVLIAAQQAEQLLAPEAVHSVVTDLEQARDPVPVFHESTGDVPQRLLTFFGMIPNLPPGRVFPQIAGWLQPEDVLMASVNLAPGSDSRKGVERILPQYDNEETRRWLQVFLGDIGLNDESGRLEFRIRPDEEVTEVLCIEAVFQLKKTVRFEWMNRRIEWREGREIQVFRSYRYRMETMEQLLEAQGLEILNGATTSNQEEAVLACRRSALPKERKEARTDTTT